MTDVTLTSHAHKALYPLWTLLIVMVIIHIAFWLKTRDFQARWANVPPAPSILTAASAGLGDPALAYRVHGTVLQNMGDFGGRIINLKEYNYERLTKWFTLLHYLDSESNFAPFVASFYYGSVNNPEKLRPLIGYLELAGDSPHGEKWRWLAHGAYLARFDVKDNQLALRLATKLANLGKPDLPMWARNMRANILNADGKKEAAYNMLVSILQNSAENMHPNEVNATVAYICEQILSNQEAIDNPLCKNNTTVNIAE